MAQLECARQLHVANVLDDIRLCNDLKMLQDNNEEVESIHSNDTSFEPSEYQKALLSDVTNSPSAREFDMEQFVTTTAFKCPRNHSMLTHPKEDLIKDRGKCSKCDMDLSSHPFRHCKICNYNVCLQCYTASPSDCVARHGLITFSPQIQQTHQFYCDVCGTTIRRNDQMHSCRKCDYDVCSDCYVPRTVLKNIDLNDIPLEPYKYDVIFSNNYDEIIHNGAGGEQNNGIHVHVHKPVDEYKINAMAVLKFDFEAKDIDISYNVHREEEYIDGIVSEIDKICDEVADLQQEIIKKKQLIVKLRQVEINKRTHLNSVQKWMKQNKLKWESFKLRWREWDLECFVEFLKRVELECCSFAKYYSNIDCETQIEKYMNRNVERFGSDIFSGKTHLRLFNELSLYRIGIINDKDCSIIYEQIQKIIEFEKKKRKKKSSKKRKKKGYRQRSRVHLDIDEPYDIDINGAQDISSYDESDYKEDEAELLIFLKGIKLEAYYHRLIKDGFDDMNALNILDKSDLVSIGMKPGHIKKLLKRIEILHGKEQAQSIINGEVEGQQKKPLHHYPSPK
eukprot:56194_1